MRSLLLVAICCVAISAVPVLETARFSLEPNQALGARHGWSKVTKAAAETPFILNIALKQSNLEMLNDLFWKVSTPSSPLYGAHMTMEQISEIVAPADRDIAAVRKWIESEYHTIRTTHNRDFLIVETTVAAVERLLNVEMHTFSHASLGEVIRSEQAYTVPAEIASKIDFIGNVNRFPTQRKLSVSPQAEAHLAVTPDVLRKRYNLSRDDIGSNPDNKQATAQFLKQHYSPLDLDEFFLEMGLLFKHEKKVEKVIGPNHIPAGVEASLDIEYIMSTGAGIPTWFWSVDGLNAGQEPFLEWMIDVSNTSYVPPVMSVSYGDDEPSLDISYMQRINVEFQKAGIRGISILFASGDSGATCSNGTFTPSFPASSPFVTAVGGTLLGMLSESEEANYISGGGFSNVFAMENYQKDAVASYIKNYPEIPAKYFNASGRAYPDVAAASSGFVVVTNLIPTPGVAGTSAATPTFAGIVSLINDRRLTAGKSPLGFLNPWLYTHADTLFDVTKGCTAGCRDGSDEAMFCSLDGWDATTGLGTPNYPSMLAAALA